MEGSSAAFQRGDKIKLKHSRISLYRRQCKSMAPVGNLKGAISRRINIQHRLVYQVLQEEHVVKVLRMWTHYE